VRSQKMALAIKYLVNTFQADGPYTQRKITNNNSYEFGSFRIAKPLTVGRNLTISQYFR